MPTPLQKFLMRSQGGDGWNAGNDPRMGPSATQQLGFQPMQQRGPNYGRMGGGLFGMGVSTPMAIGYNQYGGGMTPMMSRTGAASAPTQSAVQQAQAQTLSGPFLSGHCLMRRLRKLALTAHLSTTLPVPTMRLATTFLYHCDFLGFATAPCKTPSISSYSSGVLRMRPLLFPFAVRI